MKRADRSSHYAPCVATGESPSGPIKRKSTLGRTLREIREKAGVPAEAAWKRLGCSQAKVSRIEGGRVSIKLAELEALLGLYGVDDQTRDHVLVIWEDAKRPAKKVESLSELPRKVQSLVRLQNEASLVQCLQPLLVPGLLQTAEYARAVHQADVFVPADTVERSVKIRVRRQEILDEPDPLRFHAVIDESVIRRFIGGPDVMVAQLEHLLHLNERPNITIQVRPFSAGAYGTMGGSVTILRFPDPEDPPSVYLEYPAGGEWVEDPDAVAGFITVFDRASQSSLSGSEMTEMVSAQIAELRSR